MTNNMFESVHDYGGVRVYENLPISNLKKLVLQSKQESLRGIISGSSIFWWDANDAIHKQMAKRLGVDYKLQDSLYLQTHDDQLRLIRDQYVWTAQKMRGNPAMNMFLNSDIYLQVPDRWEWHKGSEYNNMAHKGIIKENAISIQSQEFKNWFGNSKVVDDDGNPQPVYHGTARPDRVGVTFRKSRATAGPMPYFTVNPEIASGYSVGKQDTSISDEEYDYDNWFKLKLPGHRTAMSLPRAWYALSLEDQKIIRTLAPRVTKDDRAEEVILGDEDVDNGIGNYQEQLRQHRGNVFKALIDSWLLSGALFGYEEEFLKVLKLSGLKYPVIYDHPHATYPFVYKVYLSIQNPLDTANIPQKVIDALIQASKKQPYRNKEVSFQWDKKTSDAREWIQELTGNDPKFVWTVVPDWVTKTLKNLGYDGIKDVGGKKFGTEQHTVWIPFEEYQVKSAISNTTFDPTKRSIVKEKKDKIIEDGVGLVVPGVNMPAGMHRDEIKRQAKKFGNKVSDTGVPPTARTDGKIMEKKKPKPTNPELWSRAKAWAKRTYDVYPSAYANAGASKWYKKHGGGWRMNEDEDMIEESDLQCVNIDEDLDYCVHCGNLILPESYSGGLRKWFREKWVNIAKKVGGKHPPCGSSGEHSGYAKCVPAKKARKMSKKSKESAVRRKRKAQSDVGRKGKDSPGSGHTPVWVKTKAKE